VLCIQRRLLWLQQEWKPQVANQQQQQQQQQELQQQRGLQQQPSCEQLAILNLAAEKVCTCMHAISTAAVKMWPAGYMF
jgi:hypothetical protein